MFKESVVDASALFVVTVATLPATVPEMNGYRLDGIDVVVQASSEVIPSAAVCVVELSVSLATDWRLIGTGSIAVEPLLYFGKGLAIVLTAFTMSMRRTQIQSISRGGRLDSAVVEG